MGATPFYVWGKSTRYKMRLEETRSQILILEVAIKYFFAILLFLEITFFKLSQDGKLSISPHYFSMEYIKQIHHSILKVRTLKHRINRTHHKNSLMHEFISALVADASKTNTLIHYIFL